MWTLPAEGAGERLEREKAAEETGKDWKEKDRQREREKDWEEKDRQKEQGKRLRGRRGEDSGWSGWSDGNG